MATECTEWPLVVLHWQAVLERAQQRWRCCLQRSLPAWRSQAARHLGSTQGLTDAPGHVQLVGMPKTRVQAGHRTQRNDSSCFSAGFAQVRTQSTTLLGSQEMTHYNLVVFVMHRTSTCASRKNICRVSCHVWFRSLKFSQQSAFLIKHAVGALGGSATTVLEAQRQHAVQSVHCGRLQHLTGRCEPLLALQLCDN